MCVCVCVCACVRVCVCVCAYALVRVPVRMVGARAVHSAKDTPDALGDPAAAPED